MDETAAGRRKWEELKRAYKNGTLIFEDNPSKSNTFETTPNPIAIKNKVVTRARGRPKGTKKEHSKILISIRLSPEVLDYFKSTGDGWQTHMDAILREYIKTHSIS